MTEKLHAKFADITIYQSQEDEKAVCGGRVFHSLAGECIGSGIYMFGTDSNSIGRLDSDTGRMEVQYGDEEQRYSRTYLYTASFATEKAIYFISNKLQHLLKFDPVSGRKSCIPYEGAALDYVSCQYGKRLFLLPVGYSDRLICVDLELDTVRYIPSHYETSLNESVRSQPYIYGNGIVEGRFLYRGSHLDSSVQQFDMETGRFRYVAVKGFQGAFRQIAFDGEFFWLLSKSDGHLIQWDQRKNQILYMLDLAKETGKPGMVYATCVCRDGMIYVPEKAGSCILKVDVHKKTLWIYDCNDIPGFQLKKPNAQAFAEGIRENDRRELCFIPFYANGVILWDREDRVRFYPTATSQMLGAAEEQQDQTEYTCCLRDFCNQLCPDSRETQAVDSVGKRVFECCKIGGSIK